jgi:hypothetical protein
VHQGSLLESWRVGAVGNVGRLALGAVGNVGGLGLSCRLAEAEVCYSCGARAILIFDAMQLQLFESSTRVEVSTRLSTCCSHATRPHATSTCSICARAAAAATASSLFY